MGKKLIISLLVLLTAWQSAKAQDEWTLNEDLYSDETVFWCDLLQTVPTPTFHMEDYEVAAFIDGELRGLADMGMAANMGFFVIRVKGNETDMNKPITFKARHSEQRTIYPLTLKEAPTTVYFDGETQNPGTPSNLRHLYLTEPTSISFPENIKITINKPVNMLDYLTVEPADAPLPENLIWSVGGQLSEDYYTFVGTTLTGLKATDQLLVSCSAGNLYAWTTVIVEEVKVSFTLDVEDLVFGKESVITVTPEPTDAEVDPSLLAVNAYNAYYPWAQTLGSLTKKGNHYEATYTPNAPGYTTVLVNYDGSRVASALAEVGFPLSLDEGWQWYSSTYGNVASDQLETAFGGNSLIEIRSQRQLLYNDPEYGYFGTLKEGGIRQNVCYKIKMKNAWNGYTMHNGGQNDGDPELTMNEGWTWLANPYVYRRNINRLTNVTQAVGDRIVSKNSGFAEYDGSRWVGSLTMLEPSQGYMFHTEQAGTKISFAEEEALTPSDDAPASGSLLGNQLWLYDPSLYSDNMCVVATIEGITPDSRYSVGAYVDGECRGEGIYCNDRLFIVAHGKLGETVNFLLHDDDTSETYNINETLPLQQAVGRLRQPVRFTRGGATSVWSVSSDSSGSKAVYDLQGRSLPSLHRGMNLLRQSDGTIRKVYVK